MSIIFAVQKLEDWSQAVFAAFKLIVTLGIAGASVLAAIVESRQPVLVCCLSAAFVVGVLAAHGFRNYRQQTVRSAPNQYR
jgi:hypothetical protein